MNPRFEQFLTGVCCDRCLLRCRVVSNENITVNRRLYKLVCLMSMHSLSICLFELGLMGARREIDN